MNELAKFKEEYDHKLAQRLTEQIDRLNLDITVLTMKNNDQKAEIASLRAENLSLKTEWEMK